MPNTLHLAMLLHVDLPPGASDEVAERAWSQCFHPLIGAIHHVPTVQLGLVITSWALLDLERRHPEGLEWVRALVERGQIELVGTAAFEPVLSAVPAEDAVGQLRAHATVARRALGVRPTGAWLPHGVWDPSVPALLVDAELGWCSVGERCLRGQAAEPIWGVYRTERTGSGVGLLPSDRRLGDMVCEVPVQQVIGYLRDRAAQDVRLLTLALSAGRFGLYPRRSDSARDQAWFASFLAALAAAAPTVQTLRPGDAVARIPPRELVYLPSCSPREVGVPFERHLARYPEAHRLHQKMLRVSSLVSRLASRVRSAAHSEARPDPQLLLQCRQYLYQAQAAPVYWHGPHRGIYDAGLRHQAWRDTLRAERVALDALGRRDAASVDLVDLDADGRPEIALRTAAGAATVDPASGGVVELSWYEAAQNVMATLTRVREPYHEAMLDMPVEDVTDGRIQTDEVELEELGKAAQEAMAAKRIRDALEHDGGARASFVTRVIGPNVTFEAVQRLRLATRPLFPEGPWQVVTADQEADGAVAAVLSAEGEVEDGRIRLTRRYALLASGALELRQVVANKAHEAVHVRLALTLDLSLDGDPERCALLVGGRRHPCDVASDLGDTDAIVVEGPQTRVSLSLSQPCRSWAWPIRSVHREEGEVVVAVQGIALTLVVPIELWGHEKAVLDVIVAPVT